MLRYVNKNIIKEKQRPSLNTLHSSFFLRCFGIVVVRSNSLSDYALKLSLGLPLGFTCLVNLILRHLLNLHRMYIAAYDEQK